MYPWTDKGVYTDDKAKEFERFLLTQEEIKCSNSRQKFLAVLIDTSRRPCGLAVEPDCWSSRIPGSDGWTQARDDSNGYSILSIETWDWGDFASMDIKWRCKEGGSVIGLDSIWQKSFTSWWLIFLSVVDEEGYFAIITRCPNPQSHHSADA